MTTPRKTLDDLARQAAEILSAIPEIIGEAYRAGYRAGWDESREDRRTAALGHLADAIKRDDQ